MLTKNFTIDKNRHKFRLLDNNIVKTFPRELREFLKCENANFIVFVMKSIFILIVINV